MSDDTATETDDLRESRLYTFLDGDRENALYFLEGQRLIRDLALLHGIRGPGFAYFRDAVLGVQPMIALIKRGEQLGFYLDSEEPYFRLKIEAGHHGDTRSVLVPEDFREFPARMWGIARLRKIFPNNRPPYQSVLRVDGLPLSEIVNRVLRDSYQARCEVVVSPRSDQAVMLHRLPSLDGRDSGGAPPGAVRACGEPLDGRLGGILERALHEPADIERAFEGAGYRLLAGRPVRFRCGCSRERMIGNLWAVSEGDWDELFDPGQRQLEVTCEYCKTAYVFSRAELESSEGRPN